MNPLAKFLEDEGPFPLDQFKKMAFADYEQQQIQTMYRCFLMENQLAIENDVMPPRCIGTLMELWGVIQFFLKRAKKDPSDYYFDDDELDARWYHELQRARIPFAKPTVTAVDGILKKICRIQVNIERIDFKARNISVYHSRKQEKIDVAQYMVPRMLKYGQYPVDGKNIRYACLTEKEQDFFSLLYLEIIWTQDLLQVGDRFMPMPVGTGMELWIMLQISLGNLRLRAPGVTVDFSVSETLLATIFGPTTRSKLLLGPSSSGGVNNNNQDKHIEKALFSKISERSYRDHVNHFRRLAEFRMNHQVKQYSTDVKDAITKLCSSPERFSHKSRDENAEPLFLDYVRNPSDGIWRLQRIPITLSYQFIMQAYETESDDDGGGSHGERAQTGRSFSQWQ